MELKHVCTGVHWHWEVKCPKCNKWVPVSDGSAELIRQDKEGMSCSDNGENHWKTFTKEGALIRQSEEFQTRFTDECCNYLESKGGSHV